MCRISRDFTLRFSFFCGRGNRFSGTGASAAGTAPPGPEELLRAAAWGELRGPVTERNRLRCKKSGTTEESKT